MPAPRCPQPGRLCPQAEYHGTEHCRHQPSRGFLCQNSRQGSHEGRGRNELLCQCRRSEGPRARGRRPLGTRAPHRRSESITQCSKSDPTRLKGPCVELRGFHDSDVKRVDIRLSVKCGGCVWGRGALLVLLALAAVGGGVRAGAGAGAAGPVPLGARLVCARSPGLTERQRALCRAAPQAMAAVADGLRLAYAECAVQMRLRRWNCSGVSDGRHFPHVLPRGTREAAYTYAITSAGVAHALAAACARGDLPACGCGARRRAAPAEQWEWGGGGVRCGAGEVAQGARLARRFLDARELEQDARALMNLHNNRLGRKVVKELVSRVCKCHGVSGSCTVRTCWRAPPPFRRVAAALTARYHRAKKVVAYERGTNVDGRANLQLVVNKGAAAAAAAAWRAPRKAELVYLESSPAYCEPDPAHAALGTHRRLCNHTSTGEDGCAHLCCGRGYTTRREAVRAQCRCSFHWCCRVRCDTCLVRTELHVCN